jgi:DNA-binding GntR family transcriptional regulator
MKADMANDFGIDESNWRLTDEDRPLSLAEQIAERISIEILRGRYQPGERIIEQGIADSFKVSRGPVRDAIRILEREGVVEILPRRGAQITQLNMKEVDDIFAIRGALIELGVFLATPNLSDAEKQRISSWVDVLSNHDTLHGPNEHYVAISYHISLFISRRCGNDRLFEMIRSMSRQTLLYSHLALRDTVRRDKSRKLWKNLSNFLTVGDAANASKIARELVDASGQSARMYLASSNQT